MTKAKAKAKLALLKATRKEISKQYAGVVEIEMLSESATKTRQLIEITIKGLDEMIEIAEIEITLENL